MYYSYFGLKEAPFSIAPNPDYLLMTERHQEALAHLYHGIGSDAGFVLLTGEIGSGKTTVCRHFLNRLPENTQTAFVLNPCLDDLELLQAICHELEVPFSEDASLRSLNDIIYQKLLQNHVDNITTVLLVDEAQQMGNRGLELIRLLTNLETDTQKLLKIILVGQPELNDVLARPELLQLSQRVTTRYHIAPLSIHELNHYVQHRLKMAGYEQHDMLFPPARIKQLFSLSKGIPRVINVICDRALLGAYSNGLSAVTQKVLKNAYREVSGQPVKNFPSISYSHMWIFCVTFLVLVAVATAYYLNSWPSIQKNIVPHPLLLDKENQQSPAQTPTVKNSVPEQQKLPFIKDNRKAVALLLHNILPRYHTVDTCDGLKDIDWRCDSLNVISWSDLKNINRPAILRLVKEGNEFYGVLVAIKNNYGTLITQEEGAEKIVRHQVPLLTLGEYWSGDFTYLWQAPAGFERFVYQDSPENQVQWLANLFSQLDRQESLLTQGKYNSRLKKRIEIFQRQEGLKEDGKAGTQTLLKLNERAGTAMTLNSGI